MKRTGHFSPHETRENRWIEEDELMFSLERWYENGKATPKWRVTDVGGTRLVLSKDQVQDLVSRIEGFLRRKGKTR